MAKAAKILRHIQDHQTIKKSNFHDCITTWKIIAPSALLRWRAILKQMDVILDFEWPAPFSIRVVLTEYVCQMSSLYHNLKDYITICSVKVVAILKKMVAILDFWVASSIFHKSGPYRVCVPNLILVSQPERLYHSGVCSTKTIILSRSQPCCIPVMWLSVPLPCPAPIPPQPIPCSPFYSTWGQDSDWPECCHLWGPAEPGWVTSSWDYEHCVFLCVQCSVITCVSRPLLCLPVSCYEFSALY